MKTTEYGEKLWLTELFSMKAVFERRRRGLGAATVLSRFSSSTLAARRRAHRGLAERMRKCCSFAGMDGR